MSAVVGRLIEEGVRLAKVYCYCPECKKMLTQVLSSFECLAPGTKLKTTMCREMTASGEQVP